MLTPSVTVHDRLNGAKNHFRVGHFKSPERGVYVIPDGCDGEVHAQIEANGDIAISVFDSNGRSMGRGTLLYSDKQNDFPGIMQPYSNGPNPLPLNDAQELGRAIRAHRESNGARLYHDTGPPQQNHDKECDKIYTQSRETAARDKA